MKKLAILISVALTLFTGCNNGDGLFGGLDFDDYTEQNVYFPVQYPVRTLILGEDRIDNSIDNQHAFHIGASIGGLRENGQDIQLEYALAPELLVNLQGVDSKSNELRDLKLMPTDYYTIDNEGKATIKKGEFNGLMRVNLTDAYFNDPESYKLTYAIPLKLLSTSFGKLLSGTPKASAANPSRVNADDWESGGLPKDYTIFAVKYINPWHGNFFQRGTQKLNGAVDKVFHTQDLEDGQTSAIVTTGYRKALYQRMGEFFGEAYSSELSFSESSDGEGTITVAAPEGSTYTISGSGKYYESTTDFAKEHGAWLLDPKTEQDIPHLTLTLDFEVTGLGAPENVYQFTDTLVLRDKGVTYEEFIPSIVE